MCSHPALTPASAIALTLRAVCGLTTAEIASAFLVPEATMAQRISRAKNTIKASGVPFNVPTDRERAQRLRAVLHVLYLIFSEGYTSSGGPHLQRFHLTHEATRLTRALHHLLQEDGEVAGLLALMLLTDARRAARCGADGELIPLTKQDRTLWDQKEISEGVALITGALSKGLVGAYQLQAAIVAVHDEAARAEDTDWPQILALYDLLKGMSDNPMVILNHAIAAARVNGPARGLELLKALDADRRLKGHHRLDAVRAHLLEMAGDHNAAINHYRIAASRTTSLPERNYLLPPSRAATRERSKASIRESIAPLRVAISARRHRRPHAPGHVEPFAEGLSFDRFGAESQHVAVQVLDLHLECPSVVSEWIADPGALSPVFRFESGGVIDADPNPGSGVSLVSLAQKMVHLSRETEATSLGFPQSSRNPRIPT
jgi:predicted RNA polymerase sigma factor